MGEDVLALSLATWYRTHIYRPVEVFDGRLLEGEDHLPSLIVWSEPRIDVIVG